MIDYADKYWVKQAEIDDMWRERQENIRRLNDEGIARYKAERVNARLNKSGNCVESYRNNGSI